MVKQCAGLPLAIIVLAGILASKNSLYEWQMVFDNVKLYLKEGRGQGTEEVLALSYDDLPPFLKPCFLYLSHFPEDYEIHAKRLIELWVAEGIVSSNQEEGNGGEITEHVAESYLNELAGRSMIQVRERDAILKIKMFQMHDLMRDLCLSKAKHENFLCIMSESIPYSDRNSVVPVTIRRVRRVATPDFFGIHRIKCKNLRSLVIFDDIIFNLSWSKSLSILDEYMKNHDRSDDNYCKSPILLIVGILAFSLLLSKIGGIWAYMLTNFKLLRVLDFKGRHTEAGCKLPSDIGNLIHLRFLSLRRITFGSSKFPSSLGNLSCLQTLDLRVRGGGCSDSIHVPNVIWKMHELRHLYLPKRCDRKTKLKLATLRKLQTFENFSTRSCYVKDLVNMTNLSDLKILLPFSVEDFKEDLEMNPPILATKYLRSLYMKTGYYEQGIDPSQLAHLLSSCVSIYELRLSVKIRKLADYNHFSSSIAHINLNNCKIEEDPMPTLEKLCHLRILQLYTQAFIGKEIVCSAQCFTKLDSLILKQLYNLEEWKMDEGAMPALRYLEIYYCKNLKELPDGLRFITTLKDLRFELMSKAFKDKLVEGGEDFYKVQHVPSIIFKNCG